MTGDPTRDPADRPAPSAASPGVERMFLVVVDDTEEMRVALQFCCYRARKTGTRIALFRAIEPAEFHHWAGVGEIMREERRAEAETLLSELSREVHRLTGRIPVLFVREGHVRDELLALINEEPAVSVLVLAASAGTDGPGPLISYLAGKGSNTLHIPITIVPGNLTEQQIDALT